MKKGRVAASLRRFYGPSFGALIGAPRITVAKNPGPNFHRYPGEARIMRNCYEISHQDTKTPRHEGYIKGSFINRLLVPLCLSALVAKILIGLRAMAGHHEELP